MPRICASALDNAAILNEDSLTDSNDYDEIRNLEDDILSDLKEYYVLEYGKEPNEMPDYIDFSNSVRIYVDIDILALKTDNQEEIIDALEKGNYVWDLYIPIDDVLCRVTIARGQMLDEERGAVLNDKEKDSIQQFEGKWKITAFSIGVNTSTYQAQIQQRLVSDSINPNVEKVLIVGGIPAFRYPVAIAFDGKKAVQWLTFEDGDFVTSTLAKEREKLQRADTDTETLLESEENGIFNFCMLADYARENCTPNISTNSGGGAVREASVSIVPFIAGGIITVFMVIGIRRYYNKAHSDESIS